MRFEVWSEGYAATGEHGTAMCHGVYEAENFQLACDLAFSESLGLVEGIGSDGRRVFTSGGRQFDACYDRDKLTYWGCKLFTNETEARMSFG